MSKSIQELSGVELARAVADVAWSRIAELEEGLRQILINREEDDGGPCVEGMNGRPCDCSQCVARRALGDLRNAARLVKGKDSK